ncbi:Type 4 prepilin-like proteins leader peptide-processing enzyme [bacterium HR23]|nr:Type 4 prepilin-like proteins leader peptide-processing enzyme [bacterium HR23]
MVSLPWAIGGGLAGLLLGPLLNRAMDRLPREGRGLLAPWAVCPRCHREVALGHRIPVFGVWAHGRLCNFPFPWRPVAVETLTPPVFALTVWHLGATFETLVILAFLCILAVALVCDIERTLIPNRLVYPALPLVLALAPLAPPGSHWLGPSSYLNALAGAGSALGVFLMVYLLARGRMGAGDVKLATLIGAMLGFPMSLVALGVAFVGGGIGALTLLALRRKGLQDTLPYGPFLVGGAVVALFWGEDVLRTYLTLLWGAG